jgi:peroxiredoxin (alkyl hydroperoxide reductase subunit C)
MENNNTVQEYRLPLIGDKAPAFTAVTTQGTMNFPEDYRGSWAILFSHPADFTPVCTTEFMTFAKMQNEFDALNTKLIGLSIDSVHSHIAWLRRIQELEWKDIKNPEVKFPVIADLSMDVAKKYGMVHPEQSSTSAVRAVFIIDPESKVRAILYYPMSTGRNFHELKRMVLALQKADAESVATPADWEPGVDVIVPSPTSCGGARERMAEKKKGQVCLDWFLCFRKDNKQ